MCPVTPAIQFTGITKEYRALFRKRRVRALDDFTLEVETGEVFGFLGPNGAGKTTAIHVAMGFVQPTKGGGSMLGQPFGHSETRRRVGFLAENVALYHRPAEDLVRFYGALNGLSGKELDRRSRDILDRVGLLPAARRNVAKFSRGMLQRVGLAQAFIHDPDLLILDEPTSALDPVARVAVRELLLTARSQGKTIFISSHLLSEIELICDRIAVLNHGRVVRLGRTHDLLESGERSQITARNVPAGSFPGAMVSNGRLTFPVGTREVRTVLEKIWAMGGEVVSVQPEKRSLEQFFLELTSPDSDFPAAREHS
jgi:ABC-2 type transport system ATP-binding protein